MARTPVMIKLTPGIVEAIDAAGKRINKSRSATIEILIYLYASKLDEKTKIPINAIPRGSRSHRSKK